MALLSISLKSVRLTSPFISSCVARTGPVLCFAALGDVLDDRTSWRRRPSTPRLAAIVRCTQIRRAVLPQIPLLGLERVDLAGVEPQTIFFRGKPIVGCETCCTLSWAVRRACIRACRTAAG